MDRLFREGAEKYEVKPSAAAWEAIQGQVGAKASVWPTVWKVAAVLVVMISSALVVFTWEDNTSDQLAGQADHPQLKFESYAWNLPEVSKANDPVIIDIPAPVKISTPQEEEVVVIAAVTADDRPYLELRSLQISWEIEMPATPALYNVLKEETTVTIRYYASASETDKSKKKIGQFIARAQQKLNPDELLADIRTAKDDLFRSNRGD